MLFRALRSTKNNASDVRKLPKASNQPGNRWLSTVFQQPARITSELPTIQELGDSAQSVLSQRFPGWFEAFGSFRTSEALFFVLRSARKSISAPFRDTTARAHYAGTVLRLSFRMPPRLYAPHPHCKIHPTFTLPHSPTLPN